MAHYAFLDEFNNVTEVIVGVDESDILDGKDPETWYGEFRGQRCIRTSYNGNIRKNFAGVGYRYNEELDAFIPRQPYPSWILDLDSYTWKAPKPFPEERLDSEGISEPIFWDESSLSWKYVGDLNE